MKNRDFIDSRRIEITGKILLGIVFLLLLRIWYLQIIKGPEYTELSQRNTIRAIRVEGIRGNITDRNGVILSQNQPGFNALVFRAERNPLSSENWAHVFRRLDIDKTLFDFPVKRYEYLIKDIDWETVAWLEERKAYLPELNIEVYPKRHYPHGEVMAHVLGYTGEINRAELESLSGEGYSVGDSIGKSGVEKSMEGSLRGQSGGKQVLVNAYGHQIDVLAEKKPSKGNDVVLTLDLEIQRIVEEEMGEHSGAIVVMDPQTGEILALASRPAFDPNTLTGRITREAWQDFLDSGATFESKAFRGGYPPGSTFKPVVSIAALEEGMIGLNDKLYCPGEYRLGSHVFRCWYAPGHGAVNMTEAMVFSCNVFFYKLGSRVGIRRITQYAAKFGLGELTGINLPGESAGLFPAPEWKRSRFDLPWYPGDTVNASIGQGYILSTPLQIAVMYSALANGGRVLTPRIIHSVRGNEGRLLWEGALSEKSNLKLSAENMEAIKASLREVVTRGTGINALISDIPSSGKTGTSQNPHGENHAWFAGYAPSDHPSLCVVVMLEHAGHGSAAAAPIFKNIVKRTLSR